MSISRNFKQVVAMVVVVLFSAPLQAGELRISVAASMTDLFKDLLATYEKRHPEVKIIPNFGP